MISTKEYQERFALIITGWEPLDYPLDSHDRQVVLTNGTRRYVKSDGTMCVTVYNKDGDGSIDEDFTCEQRLISQDLVSIESKRNPKGIADSAPIAISDDTKALITSSVSENTLRNYRYWSKKIEQWRSGRLMDDALLAKYITELHQQGKSPATISQAVAAVKWQQAKNAQIEIVGEITSTTLAGIRRDGRDRGRGQVDALTREDVIRVCSFAEREGTVAGLRDSALIRLMSDCLLRISEAVAVNVENFQDNALIVQSSKTDQLGQGEALYVGQDTIALIEQYKAKAGFSTGALFRRVRRGDKIQPHRLEVEGASRRIRFWAKEAGIQGFISGHSLRVGSAVSLAKAGASVVEMQGAGRWKSPTMPAHYAKAEIAARGAVARFFYGKGR